VGDDPGADKEPRSNFRKILGRLRGVREEVRLSLDISEAGGILRRYFVMNAFDGAMTSLGVVFGAWATDITDPRIVIGVIFCTSLAMAVSGVSGAYMTEKAEREHELNDLENAMLTNLENTIHGKAAKWVSLLAALVDGLAPFSASMVSILPFLLVMVGLLSIWQAFSVSIALTLLTLFTLGIFLGRLSGRSLLFSGLKMVVAGVVVALLSLLLERFPG